MPNEPPKTGRVYTTRGTYSANPKNLYANRGRAVAALEQQ